MLMSGILELPRCPHCNVDKPNLPALISSCQSSDHRGKNIRLWKIFSCSRCGGAVLVAATAEGAPVLEVYPSVTIIDDNIPGKAKSFLEQAQNSVHAPAGAVMLAACAVDAMLKEKGYTDGSLNKRINQAATDHLITDDMAKWAHQIRLDANDQRHADESASLPDEKDAKRVIDFSLALAQFLFILPSRVQRGIVDATTEK